MLQKVLQNTLTETLGSRLQNATYVIGVSGGSDSVALLHAAYQVLPKDRLTVLHFNHRTRGKASDADEAFVRKLSKKLGIPLVVERRKQEKLSEAALRQERMEFFRREAESRGAYILLAHHLDDQLETFLFRLIRGTQLKGLMGMKPRNGRFVRPFLSLSKNEILEYAKGHELDYREDSSNAEGVYFRNRIRKTLTPAIMKLARSYGGETAFYARFQYLLRESQELLESYDAKCDAALQKHLVHTDFFDRLDLRFISKKVRESSHFIRRVFETIDTKKMTRTSVSAVRTLIKNSRGRTQFLGGYSAEISCGFLYIQSRQQRNIWEKGIQFKKTPNAITSKEIGFEIISYPENVTFRTFQPGDRYGSKKLKEALLRRRVPRLERKLLPLMLRGNSKEVLWFPGELSGSREGIRCTFHFAPSLINLS